MDKDISCYREIPVYIVRKACQNYFIHREKRIEEEREELINKLVGTRKSLFNRSVYTREEAIHSLQNDNEYGYSSWEYVAISGKYWADKIQNLLDLCCVPAGEGKVFVSSELAYVMKFYKEQ